MLLRNETSVLVTQWSLVLVLYQAGWDGGDGMVGYGMRLKD